MSVTVRWGKESFHLDVDPSESLESLQRKIETQTNIPPEAQKILGLKVGAASASLASMGFKAGKPLMLVGTPKGTVLPAVEATKQEVKPGETLLMNGITNLGNTCYLNSSLQLIRSIPEVKDILQKYQGNNSLLLSLSRVLADLDGHSPVLPLQFFAEFQRKYPLFAQRDSHGGLMQQDAHEALNTLLQEVSSVLPPRYANLISGEFELTKEASEGATELITRSPFTILTCNISGEVQTIESGLQKALTEELTTAAEDGSGLTTSCNRTSRIAKSPEYLLIHLVRFSWRNDVQKNTKLLKPVTFPFVLDTCSLVTKEVGEKQKPLREELKKQYNDQVEQRKKTRKGAEQPPPPPVDSIPEVLCNESGYYELCGVISHKGRGADSGHYIYWGKGADTWVVYDDANAAAVSQDDVLRLRGVGESHIAYVLLYRSRNPLTHRPTEPY